MNKEEGASFQNRPSWDGRDHTGWANPRSAKMARGERERMNRPDVVACWVEDTPCAAASSSNARSSSAEAQSSLACSSSWDGVEHVSTRPRMSSK